MKAYNRINNLLGWGVFLLSLVVYVLTAEPSASFWDCGEFIPTSFKLEVGHPPGAPLFMMIANLFSQLAFGDVERVAFWINVMSCVASAATIMFLFWTITHIARRMTTRREEEPSKAKTIAIMGAGLVGALAYTFTDTFWFSAVEAEVYALSSLMTAVVVWAMLRWERVADQKGNERWLVFIAYMMGLSWGTLAGCFIGPYVLGVLWKKVTCPAAWVSVISSLIITVSLIIVFGYDKNGWSCSFGTAIKDGVASSPLIGVICMIFSLIITFLVSLVTKKPHETIINEAFHKPIEDEIK